MLLVLTGAIGRVPDVAIQMDVTNWQIQLKSEEQTYLGSVREWW